MKKLISIILSALMITGVSSCASAENITITNTEIRAEDVPENGTIIAALYDADSVLTGVKFYKGSETARYSEDMKEEIKQSEVIKVYVWDMEKLMPLGRVYEKSIDALPTAAPDEEEKKLTMKIQDTTVEVDWENNESVQALMELCKNEPLTIGMSMYGGFEQVGSIGTSLPRNDVQTTTKAGDIVLYSGSSLVVFYGSNSWAYTRLGHITDKTEAELRELLSNGDVTITINQETAD